MGKNMEKRCVCVCSVCRVVCVCMVCVCGVCVGWCVYVWYVCVWCVCMCRVGCVVCVCSVCRVVCMCGVVCICVVYMCGVYVCEWHLLYDWSVGRHLGCFHVLIIVNSAAVNTGVHVSFQIRVLSKYMPRCGIPGSYSNSGNSVGGLPHALSSISYM